jgi:hypothetical protein
MRRSFGLTDRAGSTPSTIGSNSEGEAMPTPTTRSPAASKSTRSGRKPGVAESNHGGAPFVVPVVHLTVPEKAVDVAFWAALSGAAAMGVVELPLAALIGTGVLVARHRRSN